jgi:hypothetical protein
LLDPIRHQLTLLLTAYGYNLYDNKNRLRADDLLVREKAAEALVEGANALRTLRGEYRRAFIPEPTRENPEPPRDKMEALRRLERLQTRLTDLATQIRSMPVPTQDRVWERFRREQTLLSQLIRHDYDLIAPAYALRDRLRALVAADWTDPVAAEVGGQADGIERAVRDRTEFLRVPGW